MPATRPPPPTGTKIASTWLLWCPESRRDRPLTGNDVVDRRTRERRRGRSSRQLVAPGLRVAVAVAPKQHFGAELANGFNLDRGRRLRHHDHRAQPKVARRKGDALGVVAGTGCDHAASAILGQVRDPVVCAAQLVSEDWLLVFPLEQHVMAEPRRKPPSGIERCLSRHVVDPAGEDQSQHRVGGHRVRFRLSSYRVGSVRAGPGRRVRECRAPCVPAR